MNSNQNIKSGDRVTKLNQNYMGGPSNVRGPSQSQVGQLQGKQHLYSGINNDRLNTLDVKGVLQQNPYALSITK